MKTSLNYQKLLENEYFSKMKFSHKLKQFGGNYEKLINYIDVGGAYTFRINREDESSPSDWTNIFVLTHDDSNSECVILSIDKSENIVILQDMRYIESCALKNLPKSEGGNILLRFSLNLILNYQQEFKLKKILLKDNSYLACDNCSDNIQLANLRIITHGKPWYMKYGFRPYNSGTGGDDEEKLKALVHNNEIINKFDISNSDILMVIKNTIKKEKLDININEIKKLLKKSKNLRFFISILLSNFNRYCCMIHNLLTYLFVGSKIGLYDFYGKSYYLNI